LLDLQTFPLTVSKAGTGSGTITSTPAGISCGTSCSGIYASGTALTLTATPAPGSTFAGWSGGGCTGTGSCTVTLNAATEVTATFAARETAILLSPSDTITTATPTYTWNAVPGATSYGLAVRDSTGVRIQEWVSASAAGCEAGTGICSLTPSTALAAGAGTWRIQTYSPAGPGPWSDSLAFTVSLSDAAILVSPAGTITTATPTYTWNAVPGATWYYLRVHDSTGVEIQEWASASAASCEAGTCSLTPSTALTAGAWKWHIQTASPDGPGPRSSGMAFTLR
jgi:hypothetical protein